MLSKLKLDTDNVVLAVAWANPNQRKAGDKTEDGFVIYDVDETEYQACVANHTKLIDGHLVVDADYVPPVIDTTPNQQEQINIALTQQLAQTKSELATANAGLIALTREVAEMKGAQA